MPSHDLRMGCRRVQFPFSGLERISHSVCYSSLGYTHLTLERACMRRLFVIKTDNLCKLTGIRSQKDRIMPMTKLSQKLLVRDATYSNSSSWTFPQTSP
jgi:hypothetical protein